MSEINFIILLIIAINPITKMLILGSLSSSLKEKIDCICVYSNIVSLLLLLSFSIIAKQLINIYSEDAILSLRKYCVTFFIMTALPVLLLLAFIPSKIIRKISKTSLIKIIIYPISIPLIVGGGTISVIMYSLKELTLLSICIGILIAILMNYVCMNQYTIFRKTFIHKYRFPILRITSAIMILYMCKLV